MLLVNFKDTDVKDIAPFNHNLLHWIRLYFYLYKLFLSHITRNKSNLSYRQIRPSVFLGLGVRSRDNLPRPIPAGQTLHASPDCGASVPASVRVVGEVVMGTIRARAVVHGREMT
jgi:hypothetical protein